MPLKKTNSNHTLQAILSSMHTHKEMEIKIFQIDCVRCAPLWYSSWI